MDKPIIDNREIKLYDSLTYACEDAKTLDIAVGYFHVSGFNELRESLTNIKQIRLIMGDETDRPTAGQLRKGHDPKEIIRERIAEILANTPDSNSDSTISCTLGFTLMVWLYRDNSYLFEGTDISLYNVMASPHPTSPVLWTMQNRTVH